MKKLSRKRREWLIAHQKKIERQRHLPRRKKKKAKKKLKLNILKAPVIMCLNKNYEGVANFITKFREKALNYEYREKFSVDFEPIKILSPDAALVLAAELDRWRQTRNVKLAPRKLNKWNLNVKRLFSEMGLFELLKIKKSHKKTDRYGQLKFFNFLTGNDSDGSIADKLMVTMNPLIGYVYNEEKLYIALSEAMTNVVQHAYPEEDRYNYTILKNQWWLAGSFDKDSGIMTVLFYDQGVGIPSTLPSKRWYSDLVLLIEKNTAYSLKHHGSLIMGSLEIGRTRSDLPHRGKGLKQLLDFSIHSNHGKMKIISGKGECEISNDDKPLMNHHAKAFGGTLIQWEIKIDKAK